MKNEIITSRIIRDASDTRQTLTHDKAIDVIGDKSLIPATTHFTQDRMVTLNDDISVGGRWEVRAFSRGGSQLWARGYATEREARSAFSSATLGSGVDEVDLHDQTGILIDARDFMTA